MGVRSVHPRGRPEGHRSRPRRVCWPWAVAAAAAASTVAVVVATAAAVAEGAATASPPPPDLIVPDELLPPLPGGLRPERTPSARGCMPAGGPCGSGTMGAAACCDGPAACVADPLVAGGAPRCQWAFGTYRGMTLTPLSRYDLLSPGLDASIKRMKSLSVDTVALVFYHFQDNDTSTEIFLDYNRYSADPTALAAAVRLIHANGLKVLLKPHIGLNNNQFRGIIQPTAAYLAAYRAHILEWSAWATTHAVDVMCVGAELKGLEPAADFWRTLVADVRGLYQGPVTYAANWDSYQTITWNDVLDFIGIDTYFPLIPPQDPPVQHTLPQLLDGWSWVFRAMSDWHERTAPDAAVVFLETGCRSIRGAAAAPWDSEVDGTVDTTEQSRYYRSLFAMAGRYPWVAGHFPWHWEAEPEHGGPTDGGYTLWGKPAAAVVGWYYRGGDGEAAVGNATVAPSQAKAVAAAVAKAAVKAEAVDKAKEVASAKKAALEEAAALSKKAAKAQAAAAVEEAAEAEKAAEAEAAAEAEEAAEAEADSDALSMAAVEAETKGTASQSPTAAAAAAAATAAATSASRSADVAATAAADAAAAVSAATVATAAASAALRTASVDAAAARALFIVANATTTDTGDGGDSGGVFATPAPAAAGAAMAASATAAVSAAAATAAVAAARVAKRAAAAATAASVAATAVAAADATAAAAAASVAVAARAA
ncbi:hypothetical protein I4F81_000787 [Pyropia yezoensis]|uniref:Uncharacterized protein n=1 Tax=Pyropia yezoensis TaxID=2788 RepID=A0ACC3BKB1_PYRYE|nr:hypothetical protein I4F81_000787 [Neopyropia yezoensis]